MQLNWTPRIHPETLGIEQALIVIDHPENRIEIAYEILDEGSQYSCTFICNAQEPFATKWHVWGYMNAVGEVKVGFGVVAAIGVPASCIFNTVVDAKRACLMHYRKNFDSKLAVIK